MGSGVRLIDSDPSPPVSLASLARDERQEKGKGGSRKKGGRDRDNKMAVMQKKAPTPFLRLPFSLRGGVKIRNPGGQGWPAYKSSALVGQDAEDSLRMHEDGFISWSFFAQQRATAYESTEASLSYAVDLYFTLLIGTLAYSVLIAPPNLLVTSPCDLNLPKVWYLRTLHASSARTYSTLPYFTYLLRRAIVPSCA